MRKPLLAKRTLARAWMTDLCRITLAVAGDEGTLDMTTGLITFPDPAEVYVGACQVDTAASRREIPADRSLVEHVVRIPDGDEDVRPGQILTVLASAMSQLVQVQFVVGQLHLASSGLWREIELSSIWSLPTTGGDTP